ncbi:uncharacterized protein FIBRA_02966 [Fibroporia radiculosa]|uniref:Alginate lyase domain-containing protein n=1 Tax=Fibroporia radiculosa TaxID=599839 RepID=J4GN79_9APHY|nr:uncharacterized protein FIBRA_02966 [Fibroporia radiculosa]CCM00920.1 predicted protein [Fibroporia radiculosa]
MKRLAFSELLHLCLLLSSGLSAVLADSNDWVNVDYVIKQIGGDASSDTASARQAIINSASSSAKSGPWTVVDKGSVQPPSGDPRDYLSWAPYHWPNCNWCTKGTTHLSNPGSNGPDDGSGDGTEDGAGDDGSNSDSGPDSDPYDDGGDSEDDGGILIVIRDHGSVVSTRTHGIYGPHRRMRKFRRSDHLFEASSAADGVSNAHPLSGNHDMHAPDGLEPRDNLPTGYIPTLPSGTIPPLSYPGSSSSSTVGTIAGTPAPAEAPAKTQSSQASCTPSPTKSLAPSATWTTCPYEVHDGKVNPDVRTLPDSPAVVSMSQSVLYNSLAYAMQKTAAYSQNAAKFVDAFFLSSTTGVHPNMNFGQMVRGPGKDHQVGTFTGVLDLRGLVKVVNGIQLLKAAGSPDWTKTRDQTMTSWMNQYITWLQTSDIGQQTASKANNHFSFYVNQLAAAKLYVGDTKGAISAIQGYFSNQYLDQVAASGEQPFEAVRTRPFHYRCFNLEAMITNAKMGDQLGLNLWTAKSKYGATIQTALDYVMGLDPKGEDVSDIFPHVAAVAAAYGDPKGKYAAFLEKQISTYKNTPFWFYDQSSAIPNSPAAQSTHKRQVDELDDNLDRTTSFVARPEEMVLDVVNEVAQIPFECPAAFANAPAIEVDDDIWVTCAELKPLYEIYTSISSNSSAPSM